MPATELLDSLDSLTSAERGRRVAHEALRLRDQPGGATALLAELGAGSAFERRLGLQIAEITDDLGYVEALLTDPEPAVRARALGVVATGLAVPDETLERLYDQAPDQSRKLLLKAVRVAGRERLAGRLVDRHRERWGDRAAAGLVTAADQATVRRLLPELGYCLGSGDWDRLARRQPDAVLDQAEADLAAVPDAAGRERWWSGIGHGVTAALDHDPVRVMDLIGRALPPTTLPWPVVTVLGRLTDLDRAAVLRMLTDPDRAGAVRRAAVTGAVRRRLPRYDDEQLARLGRIAWASDPTFAGLLSALPPSRRTTLFRSVTSSLDLDQLVLPDAVLDVLPHTERQAQARRMLGVPVIRDSHRRTWLVTAQLPYAEAFAALEPAIRQPDASDRLAVYQAVVAAAGRSRRPDELTAALDWVARVRNDQDPVRQAVLAAIAAVPVSVFTDAHAQPLEVLLTDALEARDVSAGSRLALTRIAQQAVREGARRAQPELLEWGFRAHQRLTGHAGGVSLYGLIDGLPRGREAGVYELLRPQLEAAAGRSQYELVCSVAGAFERRGWDNAHLHGLLEQAVGSAPDSGTLQRAMALWLEPPATRAERVGRLLDRDLDLVRWKPAWEAVSRQRTDLLDRVLADGARFTGLKRDHQWWSLEARTLRGWLPRQHTRYAELLAAVAADPTQPTWPRASAVRYLGEVPGAGRAALDPFLASAEVPILEAALTAMAWTDRPDLAVPTLLSYASGDRARVATYAAGRAVRFVPPSRLVATLRPLITGAEVRLTSRKEAARLLGELRPPGAAALLVSAWPDAHRDLKAAIVSTVSQHLLHEQDSWGLLDQAVTDSVPTARAVAIRRPADLAMHHRERYGGLIRAVCGRPDRTVRLAGLGALPAWARWVPAAGAICAEYLTDLDTETTVWPTAAGSLAAVAPVTGIGAAVAAVRRLAELEAAPDAPDALADRDRPARRRLTALLQRLVSVFGRETTVRRQDLRAVADVLTGRDDLLPDRLDLLVAAIRWDELAGSLRELVDLVADRPAAAVRLVAQTSTALSGSQPNWNSQEVERPVVELADRGDLAGGLLAVALTGLAGSRRHWPAEWRATLAGLRRHPLADVRQQALAVSTAPE